MPPALEDVELTNRLLHVVAGHRLLAFRMGGGVRLEFDDDALHELTIEGSLRLVLADGSEQHGDPISLAVAEQLIPLLNTPVTAAVVDPGGTLKVAFGNAYLVVPHDEMYEAWQMRSDEGLLIVSTPGGDLAIWQPGSDSPYRRAGMRTIGISEGDGLTTADGGCVAEERLWWQNKTVLRLTAFSSMCIAVSRLFDDPYDDFGGPLLHFTVLGGSGALFATAVVLLVLQRRTRTGKR